MKLIASAPEITHNAVIYTYPTGDLDIIASERFIFREPGWEEMGPKKRRGAPREAGKKSEGSDMLRSMRRARAKLRRLALANEFEYFVTLTLDQKRIDRYDPKTITKALRTWCDNMVRRKGLRYILVPELHKDGALHFHGFFAGKGLEAIDSGHRDKGGHTVYNLPQWTLGYTAAVRLYGDYSQAVAYVCKYIGKQQGQRPMGRWYYSGGALQEPRKEFADIDISDLEDREGTVSFDTPGGVIWTYHTKTEV